MLARLLKLLLTDSSTLSMHQPLLASKSTLSLLMAMLLTTNRAVSRYPTTVTSLVSHVYQANLPSVSAVLLPQLSIYSITISAWLLVPMDTMPKTTCASNAMTPAFRV